MKIDKSTMVLDALKMSKSVTGVLKKYKLDCMGCKGAVQDTIENVAVNNGLDPDALVAELNEAMS